MTVKTILSTKGSEVITIGPTATLEEAIAVLTRHRIGALVVLGADQRVIGILSERDIVRALSEHGAGALERAAGAVDDAHGRHLQRGRHHQRDHGADDRAAASATSRWWSRTAWSASSRSATWSSSGSSEMERESEALRDYIQTA